MAGDLAALQVRLDLQQAEFQKGMERATKSLGKMQRSSRDLNRSVQGMTRSISSATKGLIAMAGIGFGGAMLRGAIETADQIAKTADAIGVTVEGLQELQYAADLSGVSISQFNSNMTAFVKRIGEVRAGMGPLTTALKDYDATLLENLKKTTSQEQALAVLADRMAETKSATEQAFLANAAFGRSGITMVNMLRDGSEGLAEFSKQARDLGLIMEEDLVRSAEEYKDALTRLERRIQVTFGRAFLETVTTVMDQARSVTLAFIGSSLKGYESLKAAIKITFENLRTAALTAFEAILTPLRGLMEIGGLFSDTIADAAAKMPKLGDAMAGYSDRIHAINEAAKNQKRIIDDLITSMIADEQAKIRARKAAAELAREARKLNAALAGGDTKGGGGSGKGKTGGKLTPLQQFVIDSLAAQRAIEAIEPKLALLDEMFFSGSLDDGVYEKLKDQLLGVGQAAKGVTEEAKNLGDEISSSVVMNLTSSLGSFIDSIGEAKFSFQDFATSMLKDIAKMILQLKVLGPLMESIGSGGFGSLFSNARGGVMAGGSLLPMASGGIIRSPTVFPLANGGALAGEAGPEAIMPLRRDKAGRLGVGGSSTTVNIINQSGARVSYSESEDGSGGKSIDVLIERKMASAFASGALDRSMRANYGLKRRGE